MSFGALDLAGKTKQQTVSLLSLLRWGVCLRIPLQRGLYLHPSYSTKTNSSLTKKTSHHKASTAVTPNSSNFCSISSRTSACIWQTVSWTSSWIWMFYTGQGSSKQLTKKCTTNNKCLHLLTIHEGSWKGHLRSWEEEGNQRNKKQHIEASANNPQKVRSKEKNRKWC